MGIVFKGSQSSRRQLIYQNPFNPSVSKKHFPAFVIIYFAAQRLPTNIILLQNNVHKMLGKIFFNVAIPQPLICQETLIKQELCSQGNWIVNLHANYLNCSCSFMKFEQPLHQHVSQKITLLIAILQSSRCQCWLYGHEHCFSINVDCHICSLSLIYQMKLPAIDSWYHCSMWNISPKG